MRWMWIDQIVEYVPPPEGRMVAIKNVSLAEEHLHDHLFEAPANAGGPGERGAPRRGAVPVMPASLMIEGMAQTAGILVGSVHSFTEKVILAKIVTARFDADVFPGQTLRYEAKLERMETAGASTSGIVKRMSHSGPNAGQWQTIGQVDLMFSHLDQNMSGLEFPEENFVFSDNFRMVLRAAGLESLHKETSTPGLT
jgi:3-hydroxyacyl-[acyl-carrier-protein] dehydratase